MSKRHYCSKCGLTMTIAMGRTNIVWLMENEIFDCIECDPNAWKKAEHYHMPRKALRKNKKVYNQWSKYHG